MELAVEGDRVQERQVLALVVARAAAPDAVAVDDGLPGIGLPALGFRVRGIDVVVAVGEPGERRVLRADLAVDDGLARGRMDLDLEAPALHPRHEEGDRLRDALAGEAHRGDANGFEERRDERVGAVADGVVDRGLLMRPPPP